MLKQFADYEKDLFRILEENAAIGAKIQNERFQRDRKQYFRNSFNSLAQTKFLEIFEKELEDFDRLIPRKSDDFGQWLDLTMFVEFIASRPTSYEFKSHLYFLAACLAAQQMEGGPARVIPNLEGYLNLFHIHGDEILLSSHGHLNAAYKLEGIVRIKSVSGKLAIARYTKNESFSYENILKFAQKYEWSLDETKKSRLAQRLSLPNYFALTEFELKALFISDEKGKRHADSFDEFLRFVYPVWIPDSLGLTISYYCNAACDHCYNASGPHLKKECLNWEQMKDALTKWKELGVDEVGISGGEPFAFIDEVIGLVKGLRKAGFSEIIPFSNGFWGVEKATVRDYLLRLKEAGFGDNPKDQIKISTGEFHIKDNSLDSIFNICELHYEIIGNPARLDVEEIEKEGIVVEIVKKAKERKVADKISWQLRKSISNSGRGKKIYKALETKHVDLSKITCPVKSRGAIYQGLGWVYCTGTTFPKNYLGLGKDYNESPYKVLARSNMDIRMTFLQFGSFGDYLDYRKNELKDSIDIPLNMAKNSTPCSLCKLVYRR
jgi:organic radical activating enzyme